MMTRESPAIGRCGAGRLGAPCFCTRLGEIVVAASAAGGRCLLHLAVGAPPLRRVGLPGPGFFPFALGVVLGLLALAILFLAVRSQTEDEASLSATATCWSRWPRSCRRGFLLRARGLLSGARDVRGRPFCCSLRAPGSGARCSAPPGMVLVWAVFGLALGVQACRRQILGRTCGTSPRYASNRPVLGVHMAAIRTV